MEFGAIKLEVESWCLDLPAGFTSKVGGWVNEAVRDACKRHNFKFMEEEVLLETQDQQRELGDKPARWKEGRGDPYYYRQDGSTQEINWAPSESAMIRTYAIQLPDEGNTTPADEGPPRYILERPDTFDVFPLPDDEADWNDGNYRLVIPYWRYPATLTLDSDENFITINAEYYAIFKAVSLGFKWNRDEERALFYKGEAETHFKRIERQDKLARLPDRLTLKTRPDVHAGRPRIGLRG